MNPDSNLDQVSEVDFIETNGSRTIHSVSTQLSLNKFPGLKAMDDEDAEVEARILVLVIISVVPVSVARLTLADSGLTSRSLGPIVGTSPLDRQSQQK